MSASAARASLPASLHARRLLEKLKGVTGSDGRWTALCPAHDDTRPSLSVGIGKDDRVVVNCHAGCEAGAIVAAVGLTLPDLFPTSVGKQRAEASPPFTNAWPVVASFEYRDEQGELLYVVDRKEGPYNPSKGKPDKTCLPRRPDPSAPERWIYNLTGVRRVLYNLAEVQEAAALGKPIFVVEGEPKVEALRKLGVTATTTGGAASWRDELAEHLTGATVIVLPDNDDPGRKYASAVAASCQARGGTVRIVELPGVPLHGDVIDYLRAGGTRAALEALVEAAPDGADPAASSKAPLYRRLDAIWQDEEIMRPPPPIVPYVGWAQRSTLWIALYKSGKSTFAGYVTAQVTRGGEFLCEQCVQGTVLIIGLEEFIGDTARRLKEFNADGTRVFVVDQLPAGVAQRIALVEQMVAELRPTLVIIDSLLAWGRGTIRDLNDAAQMEPVVSALTDLAHQTGVSLFILHHGRRSDGEMLGSQSIGAAVDVLATVTKPDEKNDPTRRHVTITGRVPARDFDYRFSGGRFTLVDGDGQPTTARAAVLNYLRHSPGAGSRKLRENVRGHAASKIDDAVDELLAERFIVDRGDASGHKYYLAESVSVPTPSPDRAPAGQGPDTLPDTHGASDRLQGGCSGPPHPVGVGAGHPRPDSAPETYPCPGGCGFPFTTPVRNPCQKCRDRLEAAKPAAVPDHMALLNARLAHPEAGTL